MLIRVRHRQNDLYLRSSYKQPYRFLMFFLGAYLMVLLIRTIGMLWNGIGLQYMFTYIYTLPLSSDSAICSLNACGIFLSA